MSDRPIVTLQSVTKLYGGVAALESANFDLYAGEIHALVGENGAGKSTLCKLIAGVISPTAGRLSVDGGPVAFSAPKDANRLGIAMVFQETSLVPQLTVAQNMVLGRERAFNSVRRVRNTARQALSTSTSTPRSSLARCRRPSGRWSRSPARSSTTRE